MLYTSLCLHEFDPKTLRLEAIEAVGGKLPAEHGHGTEYHAPMETQQRWMKAGQNTWVILGW